MMVQLRYTFVCLFAALMWLGQAAKISCPILQCDDPSLDGPIDYDLCWEVEEE